MKKHDRDFTGKTAIVPGERRIISLAYVESAARVAIVTREQHDGNVILVDLAKSGSPGGYFSSDCGDESACRGLIAGIVEDLGCRLDILLNNAGMQFEEMLESCSGDNWRKREALMRDVHSTCSDRRVFS